MLLPRHMKIRCDASAPSSYPLIKNNTPQCVLSYRNKRALHNCIAIDQLDRFLNPRRRSDADTHEFNSTAVGRAGLGKYRETGARGDSLFDRGEQRRGTSGSFRGDSIQSEARAAFPWEQSWLRRNDARVFPEQVPRDANFAPQTAAESRPNRSAGRISFP